jgi:hypothetical protein
LFEWTAQIERHSPRRIVAVGLGSAVLALGGTVLVQGLADVLLIAAALGSVSLSGIALRERWRVDQLPLILADQAVRGVVGGKPVCAFQAWLGRGRVVRSPEIHVLFRASDGTERDLDATVPAEVLSGPWTFQVPDPGGTGRFVVRVAVQEGGRAWEASGEWDRQGLAPGRFSAPVARQGGRLCWRREAWGQVEVPEH